ncbi:hypothetical protein [Rheinheimera sp. 4Y26]|uniref:hypothetical protein n=1 Tax=Rheinheimera sp. 4Y26 TaxID=2977811 RepID=UPI0021B0D46C|nr:hypothetical protein [Rheinheimera sp. 4Y26]MCT6699777.1 hypothetical protein [Rheinheimera sp. 4Y26]
MEFSDKELLVIAAANRKVKAATLFRLLLIMIILCAIVLMFTGVVIAEQMIYFALMAVLLAVALPQFGSGPKYEDLLKILEDKASMQRSTI